LSRTSVTMGDVDVTASAWRLVEVGRVVLFSSGKYEGRLAAIVQIIDHKRVRSLGSVCHRLLERS
jgi:large subunit ribosomal protein L14e